MSTYFPVIVSENGAYNFALFILPRAIPHYTNLQIDMLFRIFLPNYTVYLQFICHYSYF